LQSAQYGLRAKWDEWPFRSARPILALSLDPLAAQKAHGRRPGLPRASLVPLLSKPGGAALIGYNSAPAETVALDRPGTVTRRIRTVRIPLPRELARRVVLP
jgi:hypothetical protein